MQRLADLPDACSSDLCSGGMESRAGRRSGQVQKRQDRARLRLRLGERALTVNFQNVVRAQLQPAGHEMRALDDPVGGGPVDATGHQWPGAPQQGDKAARRCRWHLPHRGIDCTARWRRALGGQMTRGSSGIASCRSRRSLASAHREASREVRSCADSGNADTCIAHGLSRLHGRLLQIT